MARFSILLLVVALLCTSISLVQACESACRGDPVKYLAQKYEAVLQYQASQLTDPKAAAAAKKLIPQVSSQLQGRGKVIDKTIFDKFRGSCPSPPGKRSPDEFCGSAKSIACFAPWGHKQGVLDSVHVAVNQVIQKVYAGQSAQVKKAMIDGTKAFCPKNCQDWIKPFQNIMLVWEQREHPRSYKVTPNCLPLGKGGI
ncbi:hypothetical protein EDD11_010187 [Mortierella claussenii]|nr:hypothetical protein EDD11_010187 [Mortierella claussenii]